jgi:hypothetical protein
LEEDEDKNNANKERKNKKIDKFKKSVTNNKEEMSNIKLLSEHNKQYNEKKRISIPFWNNSPKNKNSNRYENVFYKKTYDKNISVRDKLIPDIKNNKGFILPDLININNSNNKYNYYQNINLKKSFDPQNLNLRSMSTDKAKLTQQNIQNINSITNDTSAFTHSSKKHFSPLGFGNQNYTENISYFRMGLLSAGSSSNNNIIIPIIPIRRPVSNFNFGGGQIWSNLENYNKNINIHKNINNNNKDSYSLKTDEFENNNIDKNFIEKERELNQNNNHNKDLNNYGNLFINANTQSKNQKATEKRDKKILYLL